MAQKRTIHEVEATQEIDAEAAARGAPRQKTNDSSKPQDIQQNGTIGLKLALPAKDSKPTSVAFQKPLQLLSFSHTPQGEQVFGDGALRFWVEPPRNADLNYRYEKWIRKPEQRGRLDGLLKAACKEACTDARKRAHAMMWRGILCKILVAPYEERDKWTLNVMMIDGTLYFEEHLTDADLVEKESMDPKLRKLTYNGYAFESWCTSSQPRRQHEQAEWGGDVNTNEQWCSVVKGKIGDVRIVLGGEVDCVRDRYTGQPDTFVELKTSAAIRTGHMWDEQRFEKKLLKYYFQSFLLGVPEIVVGFRTPQGHLQTFQSFKTLEIPRMVRGKAAEWNPALCLSWGETFLTQVKKWMDNSGIAVRGPDDARKAKVGRVVFDLKDEVSFKVLSDEEVDEVRNGEDRIGFLPTWYFDTCWPSHSVTDTEGDRS